MPSPDEIRLRVSQADKALSIRRAACAEKVGDLAQRCKALAAELHDTERQLGEVLAESKGVIELEELAKFTEVPVADLTRLSAAAKPRRGRRKRAATAPVAEQAVVRPPDDSEPESTPVSTS
ncbi:hypothetical protein ABZX92_12645 [Lentzea sp. NPDC006480]|uniref:hypothetical protein n=1 Tax=Lentzea sp. NPDC006480 TaxID=3157176 RepID=UPI0033A32FFD